MLISEGLLGNEIPSVARKPLEEEGALYVSVVRHEEPRISEKKHLNERDIRDVQRVPPPTHPLTHCDTLTVLMFK